MVSSTYDNNGNLLTGDNFTNTWDYRNRLTQTQLNGTTTSYLYDIGDERIAEGANSATTTYPFTIYNVATSSGRATFTKHIFANGEPGPATDHLRSRRQSQDRKDARPHRVAVDPRPRRRGHRIK